MTRCPHCDGTGTLSGVDPSTVLFFGVWPGTKAGHYLYNRHAEMRREPVLGFDGPTVRPIRGDEDYNRQSPQEQGYARVTHIDGWTVVCCWDFTEDKRGGCNAAFAVPVIATGEDVLEAAKVAFPRKWKQLEDAGGVQIRERM